MSELSSSRGLIKSMLIIGSAQVVNILISIVKMKVAGSFAWAQRRRPTQYLQ